MGSKPVPEVVVSRPAMQRTAPSTSVTPQEPFVEPAVTRSRPAAVLLEPFRDDNPSP